MVNGAIGKVIQCRKDHIRCRFKNNVVNIYRSSINHSKGYISFTQFPLRCCWGITSHKVQGKTFIDKKVRIIYSIEQYFLYLIFMCYRSELTEAE